MRYIREMKPFQNIDGIYLVKSKNIAVTKNGKRYLNVTLQDRTGTLDCKIWEPEDDSIQPFEALDYIKVIGRTDTFNGKLQATISSVKKEKAENVIQTDYFPVSKKDRKVMFGELLSLADTVQDQNLKKLLNSFFREDKEFVKNFLNHSAAKTVHHSFVGGLLEHTLGVTKIANYIADAYPAVNKDLLLTAAILHDIGKLQELSVFPTNDYTDAGQLLGHIMIGTEMVHDHAKRIDGFPAELEMQLKHCIIAHHGELEFGSPKKPAMIEALALNLADSMDAKLQTMTEILGAGSDGDLWLGHNRFLDSNIRRTTV